jgi:hypothetical protein
LLFGIIDTGVATANPVPWSSVPNLEEPALVIETPQNYTTFNAGSILLNFTVIKPDSWNTVHMFVVHYIGEIASMAVYLDGNLTERYAMYGSNIARFSVMLNESELGLHEINVTVLSFTYYQGPAFNNSHILSTTIKDSSGPVYEYPIEVSDTVFFNVDTSTPSPSPSLSPSPSPTPTAPFIFPLSTPPPSLTQQPTQTPSSTPNNTQENLTSVLIIVGLVVAIVAVAGALFYFKKRKGML